MRYFGMKDRFETYYLTYTGIFPCYYSSIKIFDLGNTCSLPIIPDIYESMLLKIN